MLNITFFQIMPKHFNMTIAIVELYKSEKSPKDIGKLLNVNTMLVWQTLNGFIETVKVADKPNQGCPCTATTPKLVNSTRKKLRRNLERSLRKLASCKSIHGI